MRSGEGGEKRGRAFPGVPRRGPAAQTLAVSVSLPPARSAAMRTGRAETTEFQVPSALAGGTGGSRAEQCGAGAGGVAERRGATERSSAKRAPKAARSSAERMP